MLLVGRVQLHTATQHVAVFDADALADHVAGESAFAADVHAIAAFDIAGDFAHDYDFTSGDIGLHDAIAAHGYAMILECDGAFHAAVNVKRFAAGDFAFDHQGASDSGLLDRRRYGLDRRGRVQG